MTDGWASTGSGWPGGSCGGGARSVPQGRDTDELRGVAYSGVPVSAPSFERCFSTVDRGGRGARPGPGTRRGGVPADGATLDEVASRSELFGPNAVRSHHAVRGRCSPVSCTARCCGSCSPLRPCPALVGEGIDAVIIGVIVAASVGLGFTNEYRAERAAEAMHSEIRHEVATTRDGGSVSVEVTHLVPGDVVHLGVGSIVPADLRILSASNLECDESILTGESVPAEKSADPVASGAPLAELSSCLFMGTVVHEGATDAVVVAIGSSTQFGRIAVGLGEHHPQTEFQLGLTRFSGLLAKVGGVLSATIFVINVALGPPGHRRGPVLARGRRGHHPAAAARGRLHQPGHRIAAPRREEGAGQTAGVHRGPRRHRRPVH